MWLSRISPSSPLHLAAAWKILACLCFAVMNGIIRYLEGGGKTNQPDFILPLAVLVFFQNFWGVMTISLGGLGRSFRWQGPQWGAQRFLRILCALGGVYLWYASLAYLTLAESSALSFTGPIMTVIGAHFWLKEQLTPQRWAAFFITFLGAFYVMRPDYALYAKQFNLAALLPLSSAFMIAISKLMSRNLALKGISDFTLTVDLLVGMALVSLLPAILVWHWPTPSLWLALISLGILSAMAHFATHRSFVMGDVSFVMPFGFSKIIFSAMVGYIAFQEVPPFRFWGGALLIFIGAWVLSRRQLRASR